MSTNPLGAGNERSEEGQTGSEIGMTDSRLAQLEAKLLRTAIPAPSLDREKLWYECGRQAALAELQQQGAAAVEKVARPEAKRGAWHWGMLLATGVALLLGVVTWRQGQELRSLRGSLAVTKPTSTGMAIRSPANGEASAEVVKKAPILAVAEEPRVERKKGGSRSAPAKISARELAQIYSAPRDSLSFAGVRRELGIYGWTGEAPVVSSSEEGAEPESGGSQSVDKDPVDLPAPLTPFRKWNEGLGNGL